MTTDRSHRPSSAVAELSPVFLTIPMPFERWTSGYCAKGVPAKPEEITNVIRDHWDARADSFDQEGGHGLAGAEQQRAWHALIEELVGGASRRVLDVGCGTGFLALRFAELGHQVTGIDLAPQMIERARAKAEQAGLHVELAVAEGSSLPFPDESFDVVVARHVIWNLPDPDRGVAEWQRVLRPGGLLALVEGKWADNEELAIAYSRPLSRFAATLVQKAASLVATVRGAQSKRFLLRRYHRIEVALPFAGGPSAERLCRFLEEKGLVDVSARPLMDPALWGETPSFERYLATGSRARP
jgi:ubiquinone/menaquinone biosynthesis C-methylase UbiE